MAARGLGKGLDSLIPNTIGEAKEKKESKKIDSITKNIQPWYNIICIYK